MIGLWGGRSGAVIGWDRECLLKFSYQVLEVYPFVPEAGDVVEG